MENILNLLGFEKLSNYRQVREFYDYLGLELSFARFTFPAKLNFLEIEGKSERQIRQVVKVLDGYVQEVGEEIFKVFDKIHN